MKTPTEPVRTIQSRPRRAHFVLVDGAEIEGGLYLNDGQALAPYLGSRKGGWVNVVGAKRANEDAPLGHTVLQANQILMAWSPGAEIAMAGPIAGSAPREVEIEIADGTRFHGVLHLGERQRMSDFLFTCGAFVPVLEATRTKSGEKIGDFALNGSVVRLVQDVKAFAPSILAPAAAERGTPPGGTITAPRPTIRTPGGGQTPVGGTSTVRRQPRLSGHWLVQLATRSSLAKPDAQTVAGDLSVQSVWRALAERNDMADGELAAHVASAFHLPLANLDSASSEALAIVPEVVARGLGVLPLRVENKQLVLAVSDPSENEIVRQIGALTRLRLDYEIATPRDISGAIAWFYSTPESKRG